MGNRLLLLAFAILLQGRGASPVTPLPQTNGIPGFIFVTPDGLAPLLDQNPTASQKLPPGTATIEGTVTILGTSNPVAGAVVEMRKSECGRQDGESLNTTTQPDGRFTFSQVRAGNWCIGVAKAGGALSPVEYGQRSYKGRGIPVPVADGQRVQGIQLMMPRSGSISGRVTDSDSEPMGHARVLAMEAFYQNGQKRLYTLNAVQTNDLGEFSIPWLPPGEYYVAAVPEDPLRQSVMFSVSPPGMGGHRSDALPPLVMRRNLADGTTSEDVYAPVYYGGGLDPQRAQKIVVAPGSTNVIQLSFAGARMPSFHIRGRLVNGMTGQPAEGAQLRLYPRECTATAVVPYGRADKDGNFDISGVLPGSYFLYAMASTRNPNAPLPAQLQTLQPAQIQQLIAQGINLAGSVPIGSWLPIEMGNQSIANLSLTLLPGGTLDGEFIFEGSAASSLTTQQRSAFRVNLLRQPDMPGATLGGASSAAIANDPVSAFRIQNIFPGHFAVMVSPLLNPFSWTPPVLGDPLGNLYVKSIRYGNSDALSDGLRLETHTPDQRLQIIVSTGGRLQGIVTTDRNDAAPNVKVALVPEVALRNRSDLFRSATTGLDGRFDIRGVPPGEYRVFAWEDIADGAWQDAEIIRDAEPRGKVVRIREGEEITVEIVAIPRGEL